MANAMSVMIAARKEIREARSVMVNCCENKRSNAAKEIAHAILRNRTGKDRLELNKQHTDGINDEAEGQR